MSQWANAEADAVQIFGPLIFLIYIKEVLKSMTC